MARRDPEQLSRTITVTSARRSVRLRLPSARAPRHAANTCSPAPQTWRSRPSPRDAPPTVARRHRALPRSSTPLIPIESP